MASRTAERPGGATPLRTPREDDLVENTKETTTGAVARPPLPPAAALPLRRILLSKGGREEQLGILADAARRHGPVVRFRYLNRSSVLLDGADEICHVLKRHSRNYRKSENYRPVKLVTGEGLLTSDGDLWRRQRRLIQPAFGRKRVEGLAALMVTRTERMLSRWEAAYLRSARPFNLFEQAIELTLAIACESLFGADIEGRVERVLGAQPVLGAYIDSRMGVYPRLPLWVPTPRTLRFRGARAELFRLIDSLVHQRRSVGGAHGDLLDMLLAATDEDTGRGMSPGQLRDEITTFFLAGSETTAIALSWTFWLLGNHPEAEKRLHEEVDRVLGGKMPIFEDVARLPYALRVVQEAMRLYPPAWIVSRAPIEDDEVGGYRVPARTTVLISPYVTHRNPRYWGRPEAFDPDRFAPAHSEGRPEFAYFPFGGGPRKCIGDRFAMTEALLVLASIAARFRLRPVPGQRVRPNPLVSLRPAGGVHVTLEERRPS